MRNALLISLGVLTILTVPAKSYFLSSSANLNNSVTASANFNLAAPAPNQGSVIINEINWAGSQGQTSDEWIELKNITSSAIDLSGWKIKNLGDSTTPDLIIPSNKSISPNGYFLIANLDKNTSKINIDPDWITTAINLSNSGELLELLTPDQTIIDQANRNGVWYFGSNNNPKKSMERLKPPGSGTTSANWQTATTHTNMDSASESAEFGSPKAENGL